MRIVDPVAGVPELAGVAPVEVAPIEPALEPVLPGGMATGDATSEVAGDFDPEEPVDGEDAVGDDAGEGVSEDGGRETVGDLAPADPPATDGLFGTENGGTSGAVWRGVNGAVAVVAFPIGSVAGEGFGVLSSAVAGDPGPAGAAPGAGDFAVGGTPRNAGIAAPIPPD